MTPHFTLAEALKSSTAAQRGISNAPNATQHTAIKHTAVQMERVAIASGATGAFAGKDGKIAVYVENGAFWQFYSPVLCVYDNAIYISNTTDWVAA